MSFQKLLPFLDVSRAEPRESLDFTAESVASPKAYAGVLAFHKYWGKKPVEPLAFIAERVTRRGDLVVDPFSGSGVTGFAAVGLNRRYLGIDINPVAVKLSSLVLNPPAPRELRLAFTYVAEKVKREIEETYRTLTQSEPATHYLWNGDQLREVWVVVGRRRVATLEPTSFDYEIFQKYENYRPKFRSPGFSRTHGSTQTRA